MNNLNELVKQYKQIKSSAILNQIFELLEKTIIDKAKYVFYKQRFFSDENLKLCDTKKVELEDVKQELRLEIIEWINRCKHSLPFDKYLYSNLWNWKPKFINKDFLESLNVISIYRKNEEGEEENIIDNIPASEQRIEESINYDKMFNNLTIIEKMMINVLRKNSSATQQQIADIIGVTQQKISRYIKRIRKKSIKRV